MPEPRRTGMNTPKSPYLKIAGFALIALFSSSCTTTYDAYGRPQQSVDPGLAVAGVAAAGLIGYAIANDNDDDRYRHKRHSNYSRHHRSSRYYDNHYGHNYHRNHYGHY